MVRMVCRRRLDPARSRVADFAFPEHCLSLQPVYEVVHGVEGGAAMDRGSAGEDGGFARRNRAAAVHDAYVADVEPLGAGDGNFLERPPGQRRMMLENQRI